MKDIFRKRKKLRDLINSRCALKEIKKAVLQLERNDPW